MDLIEQVKLFPLKPGVYIMRDSSGTIIYVGKAKKLKNRVQQYFHNSKNRAPKINTMIRNIHSIEYILTDTELEAFLTECRLIKEIKPKYNRQMKNDKRYLYIKITTYERFPRITIVNEKDTTGSLFFVPYTSQSCVERMVSFIKEEFLIRKCSSLSYFRKSSGCLNYSLGKCMGACRETVDYKAYNECINNIVLFLEGEDSSIVNSVKERISLAADRLEFEKAAKYRDDLRAVNHVLNKQSLIQSSLRSRIILAIEPIKNCCYKVFLFKGNRVINIELFSTGNTNKASAIEYFNGMITDRLKNINLAMNEILSQKEIDEAQIIYSYLKSKKNDIKSFWIPSSWLVDEEAKLRAGLRKIVDIMF